MSRIIGFQHPENRGYQGGLPGESENPLHTERRTGTLSGFCFDHVNSGHRNQWFCQVPGLGLCAFPRFSPSFPTSFRDWIAPLSASPTGTDSFGALFCVCVCLSHGKARAALWEDAGSLSEYSTGVVREIALASDSGQWISTFRSSHWVERSLCCVLLDSIDEDDNHHSCDCIGADTDSPYTVLSTLHVPTHLRFPTTLRRECCCDPH